jgi:DNA primase
VADLSSIDILALLGQDTKLKRVASTSGGEWCGPCPFCGGRDRFRVWPDHSCGKGRWWCRQCERGGDAIDYVRARDSISYGEALELLGLSKSHDTHRYTKRRKRLEARRKPTRPAPAIPREANPPTWDPSAALAVVEECEATLWSDVGARAWTWLHERRGLSEDTIRAWRLGYNPTNRKMHGLWIPMGIVIPCFVDGVPWYIKVRRPVHTGHAYNRKKHGPKYQQVAGGKAALFGLDYLNGKRVAVICESELDAVLLWQEAGDLVDVVAIGSKGTKPALSLLSHLAGATHWLVALDSDADEAAQWWSDYSTKVHRARPLRGNDLTDFHQGGGNLRGWVTYQLERLKAEA